MAGPMHSAAPSLDDSSLFLAWDRLRRPVWMFDPAASKGVYANTSALALWGSDTLEALLARDFSNLSPAVKARTDRLVQVTADGETVSERWTFYPNGQPVTVKATISTFVLADDRPVLLFEAAPIEVGPAERRAVEALRYAPTLISLFDQEGGPLFCNPAAFSAYGGETLAYAERFVGPEAAESLRTRALEGHSAFDVCEIRTVQGIRWHHLVLTSVPDPVTGEISLLLSEQDVTARVEAEQARAAAEQKAAMAEARQQFLSDMSHELRTPLNAILGFAEVMVHDTLPERTLQQAGRIHEAGQRLLTLVNEMIIVSDQDVIVPEGHATAAATLGASKTGAPSTRRSDSGPEVLYVDDNENNRTLVATILATQGVHCETADDGLQGLTAVEQGDFDLILMDIAMPVMDGVEASRRIRALAGHRGAVPIIAVTANTLPEQLASYAAVGIDDCLAKPINMVGLLTAVSVWGAGRPEIAQDSAATAGCGASTGRPHRAGPLKN